VVQRQPAPCSGPVLSGARLPPFRPLRRRNKVLLRGGRHAPEGPNAMNEKKKPRVAVVGEAIIELVRGGDGRFALGCGGDALHVAVYLARAGMDAVFATALGEDPYSEAVLRSEERRVGKEDRAPTSTYR